MPIRFPWKTPSQRRRSRQLLLATFLCLYGLLFRLPTCQQVFHSNTNVRPNPPYSRRIGLGSGFSPSFDGEERMIDPFRCIMEGLRKLHERMREVLVAIRMEEPDDC